MLEALFRTFPLSFGLKDFLHNSEFVCVSKKHVTEDGTTKKDELG